MMEIATALKFVLLSLLLFFSVAIAAFALMVAVAIVIGYIRYRRRIGREEDDCDGEDDYDGEDGHD